jgi:hypothetical protein
MRWLTGDWRAIRCGRLSFSKPRRLLVAPELVHVFRVGLERGAKRLDRQREDLFRQRGSTSRQQGDVGDQSRGAGRSVDDRHPFFGLEQEPFAELVEKMTEGKDLTGSSVVRRNGRQASGRIEHRRDGGRDQSAGPGVAFEKVGQAGEDDPPHHASWQRLSERGRGPQRRRPGVVLGVDRTRIPRTEGDGVDLGLGVGGKHAGDEGLERRVAAVYHRDRLR